MKNPLGLIGCVFAFSTLTLVAQPETRRPEQAMQLHAIHDGIYMMEGRGGNIGVCVGSDGVLLIDDQFAPRHEMLLAELAKVTTEPVRFVVNSHWHFDHSDGNPLLGAKGAIIVAHENSRSHMATDQRIETFKREQKAYEPVGLPKLTFAQEVTFHLNGQTIEVFHPGAAHTGGDAVIVFREANVIHTGDVFVRYGRPFIDSPHGGSIDGTITACEKILARCNDATVVIPGHGDLAKKADLEAYVAMLRTMRERIAPLVAEGKSLADIIAADPLAEFKQLKGPATEIFIGLVVEGMQRK